jgi:hypothetical protein
MSGPTNSVTADPGIDATGSTDDTAALQAALNALAPGQTLVLNPGTYLISNTLTMEANTGLWAASGAIDSGGSIDAPGLTVTPGATLVAAQGLPGGAGGPGYALISNPVSGQTYVGNDGKTYPIPVAVSNITITGLAFDYGTLDDGSTHAIQFTGNSRTAGTIAVAPCTNILVQDCAFKGGDDGTAFLDCSNVTVDHDVAVGTTNAAFDNWDGTSNAVVENSVVDAANGYGILFNAMDTDGTDRSVTNVTASGNVIFGAGAKEQGFAAIYVAPLSAASSISGVTVTGNLIDNQGAPETDGIAVESSQNVTIARNDIENVEAGSIVANANSNAAILGNLLTYDDTWGGGVFALIEAGGSGITVSGNAAVHSTSGVGVYWNDPAAIISGNSYDASSKISTPDDENNNFTTEGTAVVAGMTQSTAIALSTAPRLTIFDSDVEAWFLPHAVPASDGGSPFAGTPAFAGSNEFFYLGGDSVDIWAPSGATPVLIAASGTVASALAVNNATSPTADAFVVGAGGHVIEGGPAGSTDNFMISNPNDATAWTTLISFQSGDTAELLGFNSPDTWQWEATADGAASITGKTLLLLHAGSIYECVTFTGIPADDTGFTVTQVTSGSVPYLQITH